MHAQDSFSLKITAFYNLSPISSDTTEISKVLFKTSAQNCEIFLRIIRFFSKSHDCYGIETLYLI